MFQPQKTSKGHNYPPKVTHQLTLVYCGVVQINENISILSTYLHKILQYKIPKNTATGYSTEHPASRDGMQISYIGTLIYQNVLLRIILKSQCAFQIFLLRIIIAAVRPICLKSAETVVRPLRTTSLSSYSL